MCGIAGFFKINKSSIKDPDSVLAKMLKVLLHRGPNNQGVCSYNEIHFAHTRLAIHDISNAGHQPMWSFDKRFVIVFNGEIYNYKAIRAELEKGYKITFHSQSDTEVLVNAISIWGIEKTLKNCVGMFAFSAWDAAERKLYLARDRFGEKPLYYGLQNGLLGFASELKALRILGELGWQFNIDTNSLGQYMRYGNIPAPQTIYQDIYKLLPGTYLTFNKDGKYDQAIYWDPLSVSLAGYKNPLDLSFDEAKKQLELKLLESISLQKNADVPLGAFLSGGVDSSLVVALMQSISSKPVQTFSIGFEEKKYNEAPFAKAVAQHLNTDHIEVYLSSGEAMRIVSKLPEIYDEPFADSSQIPTYLVSRIAKKEVTVCISGDGGDEMFGGYARYCQIQLLWNILQFSPRLLKKIFPKLLTLIPMGLKVKNISIGDKCHKLAEILNHSYDQSTLYQNFLSTEKNTDLLIPNAQETSYKSRLYDINEKDFQLYMILKDIISYLPNTILTKVDRASMAASLEVRAPLLDHRIFEFTRLLPKSYIIKRKQGKRVLKEILYQYVPKQLIDRPKKGFGIPYGEWLRSDLKDWASHLLDPQILNQQGLLNAEIVSSYWKEHQSGLRNWQAQLWNILMFQSWLEKWH